MKQTENKRNFQRHIVKCSNNFLFSLWCFSDTFYCTMNSRATAAVKIKYIMPKSVFTIPSLGGYKNGVHIDRGWCFYLTFIHFSFSFYLIKTYHPDTKVVWVVWIMGKGIELAIIIFFSWTLKLSNISVAKGIKIWK